MTGQSTLRKESDPLYGKSKQHFLAELGRAIDGVEYHIGNLYLVVPKHLKREYMEAYAISATAHWWVHFSDVHNCDHILLYHCHSDWSLWPLQFAAVEQFRSEPFTYLDNREWQESQKEIIENDAEKVTAIAYKASQVTLQIFEEPSER